MLGIVFAVIAGAAMSVQGVLNTRLSQSVGLFESNTVVQGIAFAVSVLVMLFFGSGDLHALAGADKWALTGGLLGAVITVTVMLAVSDLSATVAVSVILVAQLITAAAIDFFGLLGAEKRAFQWNQYVGLALLAVGIVLIKAQFGKK